MTQFDSKFYANVTRHYDQMNTDRSGYEAAWTEIAGFCGDDHKSFITDSENEYHDRQQDGRRNNRKVFSSKFSHNSDKEASSITSYLTSGKWHGVKILGFKEPQTSEKGSTEVFKEASTSDTIRALEESFNEALFYYRDRPDSRFRTAMYQVMLDAVRYGTGIMLVDWVKDKYRSHGPVGYEGFSYTAIPVEQVYLSMNKYDFIDRVYRRYTMSVRNIFETYGDAPFSDLHKNKAMLDKLEDNPEELITVMHIVEPNERYTPVGVTPIAATDKKYAEYTILLDDEVMLSLSGHDVMPYAVARYQTRTGKVYGVGSGFRALPTAKTLNLLERDALLMSNFDAFPPILTRSDFAPDINREPGSIWADGLDEEGRPTVQPFRSGSAGLLLDQIANKRPELDELFNIGLYQTLTESTKQMTATETLGRQQERASILRPIVQGLQETFLSHVISVESYHLSKNLGKLTKVGKEYVMNVEFTAPFNQELASGTVASLLNVVQAFSVIANTTGDVQVMDKINTDEAVALIARNSGIHPSTIRTAEEVEAIRIRRAAKQEEDMAIENADKLANFSSAQPPQDASGQARLFSSTEDTGLTGQGGSDIQSLINI